MSYIEQLGHENNGCAQSNNHSFIYRCTAGILFIPVTVIKTRFESGAYSYNGIFQALGKIFGT